MKTCPTCGTDRCSVTWVAMTSWDTDGWACVNGHTWVEADDAVNWQVKARAIMELQDIAYRGRLWGSWAQIWIPGVCRHPAVRCTHGDEIIHRRWRRRVCLYCGRSLRGPLPRKCFFSPTGGEHGV